MEKQVGAVSVSVPQNRISQLYSQFSTAIEIRNNFKHSVSFFYFNEVSEIIVYLATQ